MIPRAHLWGKPAALSGGGGRKQAGASGPRWARAWASAYKIVDVGRRRSVFERDDVGILRARGGGFRRRRTLRGVGHWPPPVSVRPQHRAPAGGKPMPGALAL